MNCPVVTGRETPPLTRGGPRQRPRYAGASGNTPAYAGRTRSTSDPLGRERKHSRLRGEDPQQAAPSRRARKHPRLRGEDCLVANGPSSSLGNTPAYAGRTENVCRAPREERKHPRLRGEDHIKRLRIRRAEETPPLTRGGHSNEVRLRVAHGNTPAYAGRTWQSHDDDAQ